MWFASPLSSPKLKSLSLKNNSFFRILPSMMKQEPGDNDLIPILAESFELLNPFIRKSKITLSLVFKFSFIDRIDFISDAK